MVGDGVLEQLDDALASLAAVDLRALDDQAVRDSLAGLLTMVNRLDSVVAGFTREFGDRKLSRADGFDTTGQWLAAFGRLTGPAAAKRVRAGRITRDLPSLGEAFTDGAVDAEHVNRIGLTAEQLGVDVVQQAENILVPLARMTDAHALRDSCDYLRETVVRDSKEPTERQLARRGVTASRLGEMWHLAGLLDAETGVLLRTAVDAFAGAPVAGDDRTAAQRRHDGLAELLRAVLREGKTPAVGGMRPHVALLLPLARYADLHDHTAGGAAGPSPAAGSAAGVVPPPSATSGVPFFAAPADGDEPAVLGGWGPVADALAARLTCDAFLQPMVLHPENGMPLFLGRSYRNTPPYLRKALAARDPVCRWPGCRIPADWCDSHHLQEWVEHQGDTDVDNLLMLCRYHHVCVHERGWGMHRDVDSGAVTITRPDGRPYELGPSLPRVDGHRTAPDPPPD